MSKTYEQVHAGLIYFFGRASTHACACGKQAHAWAYQYTGDPELQENGSPYSENLSDYKPMCNSCHTKFDAPRKKDWIKHQGWDAVTHEQRVKNGQIAGAAFVAKLESDPEFREAQYAHLRRMNEASKTARSKCLGCDFVSHPVGLTAHQKRTGHAGREKLDVAS